MTPAKPGRTARGKKGKEQQEDERKTDGINRDRGWQLGCAPLYLSPHRILYFELRLTKNNMTRTNKWTVHEGKADPRYFTHNGYYGTSPNNVKKDGSGRGNWGKPGDEIEDLIDAGEIPPLFNKSRRGSNSQAREARLEQVQKYEV